jgi:hypothetical protein
MEKSNGCEDLKNDKPMKKAHPLVLASRELFQIQRNTRTENKEAVKEDEVTKKRLLAYFVKSKKSKTLLKSSSFD